MQATGANLAAATDRVGAVAHGGRWELDMQPGVVAGRAPLTGWGVAVEIKTNSDSKHAVKISNIKLND